WVCERCGRAFDLENVEGWVTLTEDEDSYYKGKLTLLVPYERVCYECADELLAVVEKCEKDCLNCEATLLWGLSISDCLKFQLKFEVIELPQTKQPPKGSIEEAKEILQIFDRF
ncbi:MAG: hypothetical protein MUO78_06340, partial [candidate division Zixibacteria bacterium]|nr:hypothetical protein [candidate division Zixibacteria bacterium]